MDGGYARVWQGRDAQPPQCRGALGSGPAASRPNRRHGPGHGRAPQASRHPPPSLPVIDSCVTTLRSGIAVTTPARTLADLARAATPDELGRAIRQAEVLGLPIGERVVATDLTRSELERRFLRLCRRHRLPTPEVNARIGPFIVDFLWRDRALIVETDGYRFHRGRSAFEGDRARDVELKLRGYEVVRFTYRQVVDEAAGVARTLRALLA